MTAESARITIAYGNEPLLVDRAVSSTVKAIRAQGVEATTVTLAANDDDGGHAISDATAPTLFGGATVLIVTGVDAASEEVDAALRLFAETNPDDAWLIVTHPGGIKGKNLLDTLKKAGATQIDCAALKKGKPTLDFLAKEVSAYKRSITPGAMQALYAAIGQDLRMLAAAISQLVVDVDANPISEDAVRAYFGGVADVSGFQIADAVWDRRSEEALRALRYAMQGSDNVAVPTVIAIAGGLRSIVRVAGMGPGASEQAVAKEAGVPPWKVTALRRQWAGWSGDQRRLAAAVVALADADGAVKGGVLEGSSLDAEQKRLAIERLVVMTARPIRD